MDNSSTVQLLQECDAGTKMAVASIDDVLEQVSDQRVKSLLSESKRHHGELGDKIHGILMETGSGGKEPNVMAKGMSRMKTNWKMGMEHSDATVADLITDGCNMGVKSLNQYLNDYQTADTEAKSICRQLIKMEEQLAEELRPYL